MKTINANDRIEVYIRQVLRNIHVTPAEKHRIESDLQAHIQEALESGDDVKSIFDRMGTPAEVASAFMSEVELHYASFWMHLGAAVVDHLPKPTSFHRHRCGRYDLAASDKVFPLYPWPGVREHVPLRPPAGASSGSIGCPHHRFPGRACAKSCPDLGQSERHVKNPHNSAAASRTAGGQPGSLAYASKWSLWGKSPQTAACDCSRQWK
jgi:hypothetical protein